MPRLNPNEREELDEHYLLVAEQVAAHRGWEEATVRKIAEAAGKSRGPIQDRFKGLGLRKALIDEAYAYLSDAICLRKESACTLADLLRLIVEYLRDDKEAAALMVQVAALAGARKAKGGDELWQTIVRARVRTAKLIEGYLGDSFGANYQRTREYRAEAIVEWYEAACLTLVMSPARSNPDLVKLGVGFGIMDLEKTL